LQSAVWSLEDFDLRCGIALRSRHSSSAAGWADEWRNLPGLCGTDARPTLRRGDIVIMDNISVHKVAGIREAIEARDAALRYLPPYSPDLNPIEKFFAKLKAVLRKAAARSMESLWAVIGSCLADFPAPECAAYLASAGMVNLIVKCSSGSRCAECPNICEAGELARPGQVGETRGCLRAHQRSRGGGTASWGDSWCRSASQTAILGSGRDQYGLKRPVAGRWRALSSWGPSRSLLLRKAAVTRSWPT
jgi:DDE superfamily endonuclease